MLDVVIWYLAILALGIVTLPLGLLIFKNTKDYAYLVYKLLGTLLLSYLVWIIGSLHLMQFGVPSIALSFSIIGTASLFALKHVRHLITRDFLKKAVYYELLFLSLFAIFVFYKSFRSQISIWEQFMDFAFMQSILKTEYFPPQDPWLSGHGINYYYFGHVMAATLTKLTFIKPGVAFDLMQATTYTFFATSIFSLVLSITKKYRWAIFGVFIAALLSNASAYSVDATFWWQSSTVIPYTINEYPLMSFAMGELHGHFMDIPIATLTLICLYQMFSQNDKRLVIKIVTGLLFGLMYFTNSWDLVIYAGMLGLLLLYRLASDKKHNFKSFALDSVIIASVTIISVLPFIVNFKPGTSGIGAITTYRSPLSAFLSLFVIQLFSVAFYVYYRFFSSKQSKKRLFSTVLVSILGFAFMWGISQVTAFSMLILPMLLCLLFDGIKSKIRTIPFVEIAMLYSFILINFCEFLFMDDLYFGVWERQNTVFKVYMQLWILLAISTAYVFYYFSTLKSKIKYVFFALGIFAIKLSSSHTYSIIEHSVLEMDGKSNLDGSTYLEMIHPQDNRAAQWINDNLKNQYVIAEAPGEGSYNGSRISVFTGQATPIGWVSHEWGWRNDYSLVMSIEFDINKLFTSSDAAEIQKIVTKHKINYIYFGEIESEKYKDNSNWAVPGIYESVYSKSGVKIYKTDYETINKF